MVEARLLGLTGLGIDVCPLSCMMARTKSQFPANQTHLAVDFAEFTHQYNAKLHNFFSTHSSYSHHEILSRSGNPIPIFPNIERWFTPVALLGTSIAVQLIMERSGYPRDFLATALSAEMRSIGNVDVDVVRAEYRKTPRAEVDVLRLLTRRVRKMLASIEAMKVSHGSMLGSHDDITVQNGSLLNASIEPKSIDFIITSPPYGVESLSYLRTHLLSYRSLDSLLNYDPYRSSREIIGSEYLTRGRETAGTSAATSSTTFSKFFSGDFSATNPDRVFMMKKFFDDMLDTARQFRAWLRHNGKVAFVVGNKRLGDQVIPTDMIVTELFSAEGLRLTGSLNHKLKTNNSNSEVPWQERIIQQEAILVFEPA